MEQRRVLACFVVLMYFFSSIYCDNDGLVRIGMKKKSLDIKTLHIAKASMCKGCHANALIQKFGLQGVQFSSLTRAIMFH